MKLNLLTRQKQSLLKTLLFILLVAFAGSCSKDIDGNKGNQGSNLIVNILGVENIVMQSSAFQPAADKGLKANVATADNIVKSTLDDAQVFEFDGFEALVSTESGPYKDPATRIGQHMSHIANSSALQAASTPLPAGIKYRVVLYNAGTNTVVSSTLATSGTQLRIPVEKGQSYDWAVFSFNDNTDPDPSGSTTLTTDHRDLLHAASTTAVTIPGTSGDGQDINVDVSILLKHKLARVTVEVNTASLGNMSVLSADLGANNYFQKGTFTIKSGAISSPSTLTTNTAITFTPAGNSNIKTANFYTVGTTAIQPFSVTVNSLTVLASPSNLTLSSPQTFTFTNVLPVAGKSTTAKIEFLSAAQFTCTSIVPVGNFIVETPLTNSDLIRVNLNITKAGNVRFVSEDKNGMKFDSGEKTLAVGSQVVDLLPIISNTVLVEADGINPVPPSVTIPGGTADRPSKPNTAEDLALYPTATEYDNINFGSTNNQKTTFAIKNVLKNTTLSCSAQIDVKLKSSALTMNTSHTAPFLDNGTWTATSGAYASASSAYGSSIPQDKRITMDMVYAGNSGTFVPNFFYLFIKNLVTAPITVWADIAGSADLQMPHFTRNGDAILAGARYGSLDAYGFQTFNQYPSHTTTLGYGGHGVGGGYAECTQTGLTLQLNGLNYRYRLVWNSQATVSGTNASTVATMVLYGITKATGAPSFNGNPAFISKTRYTASGAPPLNDTDTNPSSYNP